MRERLEQIIDLISEGVIHQEASGEITLWNKAAGRIFGMTADQARGQTSTSRDWNLIFEDGSPCPGERHPSMITLATGLPLKDQIRGIKRAGQPVTWISISTSPVFEPGAPAPKAVVISFSDVSERKRAEDALRESERRLRGVAGESMLAIYETDAKGDCVYVNDKWCELTGLSPEEARGSGWRRSLHPEDRERISALWDEHIRGKKPWHFEYRFITPQGWVTWVLGTAMALRDEEGRITGYLGANLDINERKRTEEALRESEARFREVTETVREVFWLGSPDWSQVYYISPAYAQVWGRPCEELYQDGRAWLEAVLKEDLPALLAALPSEVNPGGEILFPDYRIRRPDGTIRWISARSFPVQDASGRVSRIAGIAEDITQRKAAEEALRRSNREIAIQNRISEIFATVSDDQMFARVLEVVQEALQSELGTFGYFRPDGSFVVPAMTRRAFWEKCNVPEKEIIFAAGRFSGLWREALEGRRTIIANQGPFNVPQGHIPIVNTIVAPIYYRGELLSAVHLANKESGYGQEDRELLEMIAAHIAPVLHARLRQKAGDKERVRAEEALRASQEKFSKAFLRAPLLMSISDLEDGTYLEVNEEFCAVSGFAREELLGRTSLEVGWLLPEDRIGLVSELHERGRVTGKELNLRAKDGRTVTCLYSGELIEVSGKRRLISIALDITERKRSEEALRESQARFRAMFDCITDAVILADAERRVVMANPAAEKMLGYALDELQGRTTEQIYPSREAYLEQGRLRYHSGEVSPNVLYESLYRRKDGTLFPAESMGAQVKDSLGNLLGYVGMIRDITARKRAEEEKDKLEAHLRHAQKMQAVGTLAGGIAHEFNNLLASIMGYAELAQELARGQDGLMADLAQIIRASERGRDLVRQILSFSRRPELPARPVNLNSEVGEARQMLKHLLPRMVELETSLAPELKTVSMASTHISQILTNLASNAAHAMPQGGRLSISTANVSANNMLCATCGRVFSGDYVLLKVADTGEGMDPETKRRAFEPFFTTKEVGSGTGLGLSVVHGIVKSYDGHVIWESRPGAGTVVEIYLPVYEGDEPVEPAPPAESAGPPGGEETVLLVDDEPQLREMGRRALEQMGYRVLSAQSGEEALEVYSRDQAGIALVIMDLGMPGMGGGRAMEEILRLNPGAKVLVASGYTSEPQVRQALEAGATAFVAKPFRRADLLEAIRRALDGAPAGQPGAEGAEPGASGG